MATIETIYKCYGDYFTAMQFVSKAIAKEDTRPALTHIRIEQTAEDKRFAYAADGYRLHIADISECPPIPEGQYTVIKSTKKEIILQKEDDCGSYPDIWQLIPDAPCIKDYNRNNSFDSFYAHVIRSIADGNGINHKFIKDLDPENHEWSMWYSGKEADPIGFKNNTLCAVIMPLFIEKESTFDYEMPTKHYDRFPEFPNDDSIIEEAENIISETIPETANI